MLAAHGRAGVVLDARPLGEAEGGRQLVAVRIKAEKVGSADSGHFGTGISPNNLQAQSLPAGNEEVSNSGSRTTAGSNGPVAAKLSDQLSSAERADLAKLRQRDQQVRQEEKAHAAVAGDLAGPISYSYQLGPDGRQYAVGGSVGVQAQTVTGDPLEAKRLSGRMAVAANAATNPSAQDFATARQAYAFASQTAAPSNETVRGPELNLVL